MMSTEQILKEALALPIGDRVILAESLWQSIDEDSSDSMESEERLAADKAIRRDSELSPKTARSHKEVMDSARRAIGCD